MKKLIILMVFLLPSCFNTSDEVVKKCCNEGKDELKKYLQSHQYSVLDFDERSLEKFNDSCFLLKEFIESVQEREKQPDIFIDTLLAVGNFQDLDKFKGQEKDNNPEIIRVIKGSLGFGLEEYRIVEIYSNVDGARYKNCLISFDNVCKSPFLASKKKAFTRECFSIKEYSEGVFNTEDWKKVKMEIHKTDLLTTAYFQRGGINCDGFVYILEYNSSKLLTKVSLSKSCPGEKTAIFLISELMIGLVE